MATSAVLRVQVPESDSGYRSSSETAFSHHPVFSCGLSLIQALVGAFDHAFSRIAIAIGADADTDGHMVGDRRGEVRHRQRADAIAQRLGLILEQLAQGDISSEEAVSLLQGE